MTTTLDHELDDMAPLVDPAVAERVIRDAAGIGGGFVEIYAEDRRSTSMSFDDGRIDQVTSGRDRGAGIRVVRGDTTGYAHTSDLTEAGLRTAARAAAAAAARGGSGRTGAGPVDVSVARGMSQGRVGRVAVSPSDVARAARVDLLLAADHAARSAGSEIVQVSAGVSDSVKRIFVANSEGVMAGDRVVRVLFRVSAVASGDTGMQTGSESLGHTMGWEVFDEVSVADLAATAARQALVKLGARPAPSGQMPVVIARGTGGVLFHEACGHGLEADLVAKG
ncbi:MAG: TldD/PmbA family protein, partial [Ilumatobacteraceae bacterium]